MTAIDSLTEDNESVVKHLPRDGRRSSSQRNLKVALIVLKRSLSTYSRTLSSTCQLTPGSEL